MVLYCQSVNTNLSRDHQSHIAPIDKLREPQQAKMWVSRCNSLLYRLVYLGAVLGALYLDSATEIDKVQGEEVNLRFGSDWIIFGVSKCE